MYVRCRGWAPGARSTECTVDHRTSTAPRMQTMSCTKHRSTADGEMHASSPGSGKCWLVGAGPGPPDLLTVRAAELLNRAEVVVYDDLGASSSVSLYARPEVEVVYVGKRGGRPSIKQPEINQLLVHYCRQGKRVVRMKGGCPSVFSRVSSEMAALTEAGCSFELVPGISSALAAPLFAGFPLTDASISSSFAVVSGHDVDGTDWVAFAGIPTLVILMAGTTLLAIVDRLLSCGWEPTTPVAIIRAAGMPEQHVWHAPLVSVQAAVAGAALSPCIVIVGQIAARSTSC